MIEELDEILEMLFVEKGSYYVGYEINKEKRMKLHFAPGTIVGAVNLITHRKAWHTYKCKFEIHGYAISRQDWGVLKEEYPFLVNEVNKKLLFQYLKEIRQPLLKAKQAELGTLRNRNDLTNFVTVQDLEG